MSPQFVAFAGRPWDSTQAAQPSRYVGVFETFLSARQAFSSVEFVEISARAGFRRWRGWGPQPGFIVQVEEVGASAELWPRAPQGAPSASAARPQSVMSE